MGDKLYYVVWCHAHLIVGGRVYYEEFLTDWGNKNVSVLYARLVPQEEVVWVQDHLRETTGEAWYFTFAPKSQALRIRKHKLKVRGKGLFSLPINTPAGIFADAYEDAGMSEEAGVLRS